MDKIIIFSDDWLIDWVLILEIEKRVLFNTKSKYRLTADMDFGYDYNHDDDAAVVDGWEYSFLLLQIKKDDDNLTYTTMKKWC